MKQYSTMLKCKMLFVCMGVMAGLSFAPSVFAGSATLTWNANTEPDLAGYKVYYDTVSHSGNCPAGFGANAITLGKVTTYTINNLTDGQTYYFQVTAYDTSNNQSTCSTQVSKVIPVSDTRPPATTVSPLGGTYLSAQVTLSANEAATIYYTTNGLTPTTASNVYAAPINIATTTVLKYFAKDTAGNSEAVQSQSYIINGAAPDATAPSAPTSFVATAISPTQVDLSWNASTDNIGVVGYRIYRNGFQKMTTTNTQYSDTGLSPSTVYVYKVLAFDAAGNLSGFTANVSATTQALPVTTPSGSGGGGGGSGSTQPITTIPQTTTTQNITTTTTIFTPIPPVATEVKQIEQAEQRGQATASTATENENKYAQFGSYITKKHLVAGSKGNDVEMLQKYLQVEGYLKETPTGYYGKTTQDAVQKFQQEHSISGPGQEGYGEIGVKTRTVINQHLSQANATQGNGSTKATGKSLTPEMRKKITDLIAVLQKQLVILLQQLAELMKAQKKQ